MTAPDNIYAKKDNCSETYGVWDCEGLGNYNDRVEYVLKSTSNALIAAAFEAAANHVDIFIAYLKAGEASANDNLSRSIRALTPPDAQAALQAMIDAAVKEAVGKYSARKHVEELIEFLQSDPDNIYHLPADDLELLLAKIGGAS